MQATILRDLPSLRALEQAWPAKTPPAPLLGWQAIQTWFEENEAQPFVIVLREQERLVAAAPWCLVNDRAGTRLLTGIGEDDAWYHDPWILRPEQSEAIAEALVDTLRRERGGWDMLRLDLRDSRSAALIRELGKLGVAVSERIDWKQHQTIALGDDWDAYWATRSREVRNHLRKRQRQSAPFSPRYLEADAQNLDSLLDAIFRLHRARWEGERDWTPYYRVVRTAVEEALARDELGFYALELEGRLVALELLFREGERAYMLMGIYDSESPHAALSPGILLRNWACQRLHEAGVREINLGPGHYTWKAQLETQRTETVRLSVALPSRLPAVARVAWSGIVKPYLREVPLVLRLKEAVGRVAIREPQGSPAPLAAQPEKS